MNEPRGFLAEIFASLQGEGSWVGKRQIFIRLAGCRQNCLYCDTRFARNPVLKFWKFIFSNRSIQYYKNPASVMEVIRLLGVLNKQSGPFHSITLTGGEPLEQPEFINHLAKMIKNKFKLFKIMLETNGLESIVPLNYRGLIDFISVDVKLKSSCGYAFDFRILYNFLNQVKAQDGCVKAVFNGQTTLREIKKAALLAKTYVPKWDFILQPQTGATGKKKPLPNRLEILLQTAALINPRTRLIPQLHPLLGIR